MDQESLLAEMAADIEYLPEWWLFPKEADVRGFLGTAPLFIVGDQPSTSEWGPWHPNRRAFYGLLKKLKAENAHLTDLYKKRGASSALRAGLPQDLAVHLEVFHEELVILQPRRVVALGKHAYELLWRHVPEVQLILSCTWHFAYAVRYGRIAEWERRARTALFGDGGMPPGNAGGPCAPDLDTPPRNPRSGGCSATPRNLDRMGCHGRGNGKRQRDVMRRLWKELKPDKEKVIAAYAAAERNGEVGRSSNASKKTPEAYARALLYDGLRKGWLQ